MNRVAVGLLSLAMSAASLAATEAPATYRLDLIHTGGKGTEIFAVDRLRLEPLPWPGHPSRATDDGKSGVYRFEVRDADGRLLQARGYSSIFGEWVTTDEAQNQHRSFHESLRFPAPAKPGPVQVQIYRRDAQQVFQPLWETKLDTTDMFVDRSPTAPQELIAIEQHGATADKGRPAVARRRLHGRGMRSEIPRRRRARVGGAVQGAALRAAPPGLQRVGTLPARRGIRRVTPVHGHPSCVPGRSHLRRLRQRTLPADVRKPRTARDRLAGAVRSAGDPRQQRHVRGRRYLRTVLDPGRGQLVGRLPVRA